MRDALIDHAGALVGAGKAEVVPGRVDKSVHGVGLAPCRLAALRTRAVHEVGAFRQRIAGAIRHAVLGQHHRQLIVRHRHVAATGTVHDGNRAAPVALARDAPVAQAIEHLLLAQPLRFEVGGDRFNSLMISEAVVFPGVNANTVFAFIPRLPMVGRECASGLGESCIKLTVTIISSAISSCICGLLYISAVSKLGIDYLFDRQTV